MNKKRGRKKQSIILTFKTIVGDAAPLLLGKRPMCERCHDPIGICVLSLVQLGFEYDRETDVFHCGNCGIYCSYTYDITREDT